jgi:hypothetical protein
LERQLGSFFAELEGRAESDARWREALRQRQEEREREQQRSREVARQAQLEEARGQQFLAEVEAWRFAREGRRYVAAKPFNKAQASKQVREAMAK